jgi:hypothetical protein
MLDRALEGLLDAEARLRECAAPRCRVASSTPVLEQDGADVVLDGVHASAPNDVT